VLQASTVLVKTTPGFRRDARLAHATPASVAAEARRGCGPRAADSIWLQRGSGAEYIQMFIMTDHTGANLIRIPVENNRVNRDRRGAGVLATTSCPRVAVHPAPGSQFPGCVSHTCLWLRAWPVVVLPLTRTVPNRTAESWWCCDAHV